MKTVKEFKDAGLEFVEGDMCKDSPGNVYCSKWCKAANEGDLDWCNDIIIEFAWRENTGVKPDFNGEVYMVLRSGDVFTGLASGYVWNLAGTSGDIIKWRPVITNQVQATVENNSSEQVKASADNSTVTMAAKAPESSGGSCNYYKCEIKKPTTAYKSYTAECNDILESLELTYAEANMMKAIWRTAAARLGMQKADNEANRDAEKILFFAVRHAIKHGVDIEKILGGMRY